MASFAALVSLKTIIDTVQNHPNPPISLDNQQVESLLEKITFLQEFLELYSHHELYSADDLESLIKDAAHAAEDVIESYIVDQIATEFCHVQQKKFVPIWNVFCSGSTSQGESSNRGDRFYQDLQKVVEDMDRIKGKALEIKERMGDADIESGSWTSDASQAAAPSLKSEGVMVGFDDVLEDLLDKITRQQRSSLQIIPIVGMGGIGKTTLALKVFHHGLVDYHFDIRVCVVISQNFKTRDILVEVLSQIGQDKGKGSQESEDKLGERIYKRFSGMRYLVVMDDMWSTEAWDEIKCYFPDNRNGSVLMVTTRISNLGLHQSSNSTDIKLNFLDEDASWKLFSKTVFREETCPLELEKIGKRIVENCRGLPLSIVVIGGLLAESKQTKQIWEDVARNLNLNLADDERCFRILYLSYKHLPIHLKSCFLYMGIFREDASIDISWLVKLLVAEGFLKPIDGMIMEDVVEKYINDLVQRNLIFVDKWVYTGKANSFKIHDLLRDLCIREAEKENFFCVVGVLHNGSGMGTQRRVVFKDKYPHKKLKGVSASLVRSILWNDEGGIPDLKFRLLRVLAGNDLLTYASSADHALLFYNSRYISFSIPRPFSCWSINVFETLLPSSIAHLWNLQTLIVGVEAGDICMAPIDIWKLPQLRHVYFEDPFMLPIPPDDDFVLWNLQSLSKVRNFKSSEEVVKRIPNIKELSLLNHGDDVEELPNYELVNLQQLHKIEHLEFTLFHPETEAMQMDLLLQTLAFPHSLKKLIFKSALLNWDGVTTMIGDLPNLEHLELRWIVGTEWRPAERQFSSLKFLRLSSCNDLESWTMESTHFPLLEHLHLSLLTNLPEIPSTIGEIPNIQSIEIDGCRRDSLIASAKEIAKEQEELGNPDFKVFVEVHRTRRHLERLASANFKIKFR